LSGLQAGRGLDDRLVSLAGFRDAIIAPSGMMISVRPPRHPGRMGMVTISALP
jgi:hypothetical protein